MAATGTSIDITGIDVPASAQFGDAVSIGVKVHNKTTVDVTALVIVVANAPINGDPTKDPYTIIIGDGRTLVAGEEYTFGTSGIMPNQAVTLICMGDLYSEDWGWIEDVRDTVTITLAVSKAWQKLAVAEIGAASTEKAWQKLAVAEADIAVVGKVWQKLAVAEATFGQGIDWDAFNLIAHVDFPETQTYKGNAQEVIATFQSLTVLGSIDFIKQKLIEGFTAQFTKEGLIPLSVDLYQGKSGSLVTTFVVKCVAGESVPATYSGAVAFPLVWGVIIIASLILFVIIALTFLVVKVTDLVWGPPGKESPIAAVIWPLVIGVGVVGGIILISSTQKRKEVALSR